MSMKKDGIQTRKRKPKNHANVNNNHGVSNAIHKPEIKSSLLGESMVSEFMVKPSRRMKPVVSTPESIIPFEQT